MTDFNFMGFRSYNVIWAVQLRISFPYFMHARKEPVDLVSFFGSSFHIARLLLHSISTPLPTCNAGSSCSLAKNWSLALGSWLPPLDWLYRIVMEAFTVIQLDPYCGGKQRARGNCRSRSQQSMETENKMLRPGGNKIINSVARILNSVVSWKNTKYLSCTETIGTEWDDWEVYTSQRHLAKLFANSDGNWFKIELSITHS